MSIPLWQRAQWMLTSTQDNDNPVQEVELGATFTAPSGRVAHVYGFWDGDRTWKVRFAPDEPGVWRLETRPSDPGNSDLLLDAAFRCCNDCLSECDASTYHGGGWGRLSDFRFRARRRQVVPK